MAERKLEIVEKQIATRIDSAVKGLNPDKVLVVTDTNVQDLVIPRLMESEVIKNAPRISVTPGEEGKNLDSVTQIWDSLEEIQATRRSLILNIGGGAVTDLGGFAAATFKRGIRTVNFPTTLLGAVDAATGGKTGINYKGLKNEIGAFHMPSEVIISALPFSSLSHEDLISGYAEMVKTALISDRGFYLELLNPEKVTSDSRILEEAVGKCIAVKEDVVKQDPYEKGLRKILNFGHTAGHAFESLRIESGEPVTHGKAVAHGMLVALILSHIILDFDSAELQHYLHFLKDNYGGPLMGCKDEDKVKMKMASDKKNNTFGEPAFTLLRAPGLPEINCVPSSEEMSEALELYIDMMG